MNPRRLYRCRSDRRLAGVAGGMAEYLDLDPTLVRVLWLVSIVFGGFSILLYIVLAFVMPLEPVGLPSTGPVDPAWPAHWHEPRPGTRRRRGRAGLYVGTALVVLGTIALVDAMVPGWAGHAWFGQALLVALGVALLAGSIHRDGRAPDDRPAAGSQGEDGHATPA